MRTLAAVFVSLTLIAFVRCDRNPLPDSTIYIRTAGFTDPTEPWVETERRAPLGSGKIFIRRDNAERKEYRWFELDTSRHRTRPMLVDEPVPK